MSKIHSPRLCIVGSSMYDQVTRAQRLPRPGETLMASHYHTGFGGKGANQAVAAARLGAEVTLVASLGKDAIGEMTIAHLQDEGIHTQHVIQTSDRPSGVAPIWVEESTGQNSILIAPGANLDLLPAHLAAATAAIQSSAAVICQLEIPQETCREAFRISHSSPGTKPLNILNPAPAQKLDEYLLQQTDILIPNEHEAHYLTGVEVRDTSTALKAAQLLQRRGPKMVVVTLGAQGVLALLPDQTHLMVSAPIVQAFDTTGAGDCFIAAFAFFLTSGAPPRVALERACFVAAQSVTRIGTQSSFPHRSELENSWFLGSQT